MASLQGGASALEMAALEMSNAAASLVQVEREIIQLAESGVSLTLLDILLQFRAYLSWFPKFFAKDLYLNLQSCGRWLPEAVFHAIIKSARHSVEPGSCAPEFEL